ncbi:cell division protein CrgA [Cryptosporangium sp. NPDC048952]|uniref:cell division protein CrgA n=1 Tax=Cryptosporangium sp. NPDC048952 TaxID=3363961 RepID=UPI0037247F4F
MSKLSGAYGKDRQPKRPSGTWHGALSTALIFGGAVWLLAYTLLDLPWVEALGSWNYVGVVATVVLTTIVGYTWRGAPYERPTHTSRV